MNTNEKIYYPLLYINLNRSIDRKKLMEAQFSKYNIMFERIGAIDGGEINNIKNGSIDDMKYIIRNIKTRYSKYQLGCLLSHIKALKYAQTLDTDCVIISEDDTIFKYMDRWDVSIKDIVENGPKDWNIIQLYTSGTEIIKKYLDGDNRYIKKDMNDYNFINHCCSTGLYIVSKKGINAILNKIYKNNTIHLSNLTKIVADHIIYTLDESYYYTKPMVCTYDGYIKSTIDKRGMNIYGMNCNKFLEEYFG